MAKQSSTVWILSIVFVCALAAVAFLLFRDDAGELDSEGNKIVTTGEGRSGAEADSIAIGEGTEPKPSESSRTNASAAIEEALPAEIGETVVVRGKLIVEETNAPPKNAIVSIRTGRDELDYAWMISQVGGKTVYDRLQRTGELELKFLENGGWKATFRMQARPDGSFELRVPKKAVRFTFEVVADFAAYTNPEWIYLSPSTLEKSLTVVLNEAGAIEGKIVNESGQPIAGAYVMADMNRNWNPGRPTMLTTQLTTSGKDGKFTFRGLTPGGTNMTVLAEGYGIENESNTKVEAGKTTNVEFKLQPEVPAQGLVVDAQGQGVADVTIRVYPENRGYSRSVLGYAKSDAQGRIRWKHLLAGTYKSYGSPETHRIVESPETITLPLAAGAAPPKWVVETGRFVAGRVIMTDGKPASGARVTATTFTVEGAPPLDKKQSGSQRGIAGADGTFRLAGLPNGPFTIVAKLDNVSSQTKTNIAQDTEDVEIQLPTPTGVAGTVVDATTGVGIKTFVLAVVTQRDLDRMGGRPWGWGQTYDKPQISESGEFEVGGLDPETYVVHAEADGYISASVKEIIVKSGEMTRGITLKLTAGATVAGRVIATDNGKPIPGAQVEYVSADEEDNGMRMSGGVKVRSDGSFELRGKTAGRGRITAFHEKYMEASSEIFEVQSGQRIEIPPVALGRGGAIVGIAIGRDGEVLPRSQLNAYYSGRQDSNTRPRHAYRNPNAEIDGSFKMEGLQPGEWTVSAQPAVKDNNWAESQNKQLSTKVIVVEGQTTTVVFTPPKAGGCTLRGRVTRGGKPVSNASINLWRQQTREDGEDGSVNNNYSAMLTAKGEYEIEHIPPGKANIHVSIWSESSSSFNSELEIPSAPEHRYDIDMPLGAEIKGRITRKSDGKPIVGINVHAYTYTGTGNASTQSNATSGSDGSYLLAGLSAGKVYVQAEPARWGNESKSEAAKYSPRSQEITVVEGTSTTLDFVLEEGTTVIVEVLGPDGKPMRGVWVTLESADTKGSGGGQPGYGNTNDLGIAKIQGVAPGRVKATANNEKFPPASSEVFEAVLGSEARTQIRIVQGIEVILRLVGPDGAALKPETVSLQRADGTWAGSAYFDSTGQPKDGGLKVSVLPGTYKAHFSLGQSGAVTIDVTIGEASAAIIDVKADKLPGK